MNNIDYLNEIDFTFYLRVYDKISDLMDAVRDDYNDTVFTDNEVLQGSIFNDVNAHDLVKYLKEHYKVNFEEFEDYYINYQGKRLLNGMEEKHYCDCCGELITKEQYEDWQGFCRNCYINAYVNHKLPSDELKVPKKPIKYFGLNSDKGLYCPTCRSPLVKGDICWSCGQEIDYAE